MTLFVCKNGPNQDLSNFQGLILTTIDSLASKNWPKCQFSHFENGQNTDLNILAGLIFSKIENLASQN